MRDHRLIMNTETYSSSVKLLTERAPDVRSVESVMVLHRADSLPEGLDAIGEIQLRAETMTTLLRDILDSQPATHWGINE